MENSGSVRLKAEKRRALRKGWRAERWAALWLRLKGYRIVERNFRCRQGEIDVIARRRDLVLFVEVKARNSLTEACDAVGSQAQRRISDAADIWIGRQRDAHRLSWRFDLVAILPRRPPIHLAGFF